MSLFSLIAVPMLDQFDTNISLMKLMDGTVNQENPYNIQGHIFQHKFGDFDSFIFKKGVLNGFSH